MNKHIDITELALRDAHQSLLATRMAMEDMAPACTDIDAAGYWSVECWGGATFDACIRLLNEDTWERLLLPAGSPRCAMTGSCLSPPSAVGRDYQFAAVPGSCHSPDRRAERLLSQVVAGASRPRTVIRLPALTTANRPLDGASSALTPALPAAA